LEDYEMGARLLENGTKIRFEPRAVAWHEPADGDFELTLVRAREVGRNSVRVARAHPFTVESLFGTRANYRSMRLLSILRLTSRRSLLIVSNAARVGATLAGHVPGRRLSSKLRELAGAVSFAAGVAEQDVEGQFLDRLFSRREGQRRGAENRSSGDQESRPGEWKA
jgi:GT2 family glycosyltransferase